MSGFGGVVSGYLYTRWDCPACGEAGADLEGDATNEVVKCEHCSATFVITDVR